MVLIRSLSLLTTAVYASANVIAPTPLPQLARRAEGEDAPEIKSMGAGAQIISTGESPPTDPADLAMGKGEGGGGGGGGGGLDLTVLQLADTLERLESTFYSQALKHLNLQHWLQLGIEDHQAKLIQETIETVVSDETTHSSVLTGAIGQLGGAPVKQCQFDFGHAFSDPLTFLSMARSLEAVGVSAYLGAANLISDPSLLTTAATIVTIEARHQSLLSIFTGASAIPQPFDIALTPESVLALAGGFLVGCTAADLGLETNHPLVAIDAHSQQTIFAPSTPVWLQSTVALDKNAHYCQMLWGGVQEATVAPLSSCVLPKDVTGPIAIFVTSEQTPLVADVVKQNKEIIVAGPALVFVDDVNNAAAHLFDSVLQIQQLGSANLGLHHQKFQKNQHVQIGEVQVKPTDFIVQKEISVQPVGHEKLVFSHDIESGAFKHADQVSHENLSFSKEHLSFAQGSHFKRQKGHPARL